MLEEMLSCSQKKSDGWRIGIRNPDQQSSLYDNTTTKDKAIVTSGELSKIL